MFIFIEEKLKLTSLLLLFSIEKFEQGLNNNKKYPYQNVHKSYPYQYYGQYFYCQYTAGSPHQLRSN